MRHLDLHGLSVEVALKVFTKTFNELPSGSSIEVIHGYGSSGSGGKIKRALLTLLDHNKNFIKVTSTSNLGATTIKKIGRISSYLDILSSNILEFCSENPKSLTKIERAFFKNSDPKEIRSHVKKLVKKGLLAEKVKNNKKVYLSR